MRQTPSRSQSLTLMLVLLPALAIADEPRPKAGQIPDALQRYIARPEPVFSWKEKRTVRTSQGNIYQLELVSQTWQGIVWKHVLQVFEPQEIAHREQMLLFVTGGSTGRQPSERDQKFGLKLAELCRSRIAVLRQVPNQPLLGDRYEDDLISETWLKYLETGDDSWPLLFPMVKSAVKAMDALERFSQAKWKQKLTGFVITGASKRGWTSWLTPVADKRVIGTAPIVIDVLNFRAQMTHQLKRWGKFSEQIVDYTSKGLVKRPEERESEREIALRRMMDPYTYLPVLKLPKLLIVGTNDPYWVVDSMNLYWDDLVGPKFIRQVPNAGHGLDGGLEGALATLAAFYRQVASGATPPQFSWNTRRENDQLTLEVRSDQPPRAVRLWSTQSSGTDFRKSAWTSKQLEGQTGRWTGQLKLAPKQHVAVYAEIEFALGDLPYSLTTLVYQASP